MERENAFIFVFYSLRKNLMDKNFCRSDIFPLNACNIIKSSWSERNVTESLLIISFFFLKVKLLQIDKNNKSYVKWQKFD